MSMFLGKESNIKRKNSILLLRGGGTAGPRGRSQEDSNFKIVNSPVEKSIRGSKRLSSTNLR